MSAAIRRSVGEARRIVVKVGSSSLTDSFGRIDMAQMNALVDAIAAADRKSTRLNSSHSGESRMPSSA